ncbi:MAG: hypothetical protein ACLQHF_08765 [Terracidiphilus sp.]
MANQEATKAASAVQLETESLRFTAFLSATERIGEQRWWTELTGAEPETRSSRLTLGQTQEAGPVESYGLVLATSPGRVDWLLTPRQQEGAPPEFRRAGPLVETLPFFQSLMSRWFELSPDFIRAALGVVVREPMPSRQDAYRKLAHYLPAVKIDPEGSSEFFYQVNRPRKSKTIEGLQINRLSKWSAAFLVPFGFTFVSPAQGQLGKMGEGETSCRIELDINTDPTFSGNLDRSFLPNILGEFVDLAMELVTVGEIP